VLVSGDSRPPRAEQFRLLKDRLRRRFLPARRIPSFLENPLDVEPQLRPHCLLDRPVNTDVPPHRLDELLRDLS
jgi:hypothetical protein